MRNGKMNSDILFTKESQFKDRRSKSKAELQPKDSMKKIFSENEEKSTILYKPKKKAIEVKTTVFKKITKEEKIKLDRSKSRPNIRPKDNMADCLKSPAEIIKNKTPLRKRPVNSDFNPKYNDIEINTIKSKNDNQTVNCLGDDAEIPVTTEQSNNKAKSVTRKKDAFEGNLTAQERRIKSIHPDWSIEQIRELSQKTNNKEHKRSNTDKILLSEGNTAKAKNQKELSSNIFHSELKKSLNEEVIQNVLSKGISTEPPKPKEFKKDYPTQPKPTRVTLQQRDNTLRSKSAKLRKDENLSSSIFTLDEPIIEKKDDKKSTNQTNKLAIKGKTADTKSMVSAKSTRNKSISGKKTDFINNFSEFNNESQISTKSTMEVRKAKPKPTPINTDYIEKHYIVKTIVEYKDFEIKQILREQGMHLASLNIEHNILLNSTSNRIDISLRTNKNQKNEKALAKCFKGATVEEKIIKEKPFLTKPKSDLIGTTISQFDTKMGLKLKNKNLEPSRSNLNQTRKLST